MRNLFLILLLANFGLLAWQRWIAPADEATPVIIAQDKLPRLMLAEEAMIEERAGPRAAPLDDAPPPMILGEAPGRCVSIGPFRDLAEAEQAISTLRVAGHTPEQRLTEGEVWVGHWVYLPAFDSRAAARVAMNKLKKRGVADSYIVPSGEERNAVSLGVFAERDRAERRAAEISSLGYTPRIADRHRSGAVYWVDTELEPGGSLDPELEIPGRIMRLEVEACPPSESQIAAGEAG